MQSYFETYLKALKEWQAVYSNVAAGIFDVDQLEKYEANLQDALNDYINYRIEQYNQ